MLDWKAQLYNLSDEDLDMVVWRYLTFPKFVNMISFRALWFCRLRYLTDEFEGTMPRKTFASTNEEYAKSKTVFTSPEFHRQIDEMATRNVEDGRSLTAVNCWFIDEDESERMWNEYVGSTEGVVVKSTVRKIWESTFLRSDCSFIGRVNYVDYDEHDMDIHKGGQAHERAFLKDRAKFQHEKELRITTLNMRTPACVDSLGAPLTPENLAGIGANNFDAAGLNVRFKLNSLFDTIVVAPGASDWFYNLIRHIQIKAAINWTVKRSNFDARV